MEKTETAETPRTEGARILIVAARYYRDVVDALIAGAERTLSEAGATSEIIDVPGAFEIPAAIVTAHAAAEHGRIPAFDAYVALGCVIRGETSHYDYVCGESARALMDLSMQGLAIGYGILTVENEEQAYARSTADRNKGAEATRAALSIVQLKRKLAGAVR